MHLPPDKGHYFKMCKFIHRDLNVTRKHNLKNKNTDRNDIFPVTVNIPHLAPHCI